jgi:c-di-GMP-binding flagellar brake protein YcgR
MGGSSQPERRQYQRIKKHFILTYFDKADPDVRFSASQLKNISLGGLCLITDQSFPIGTSLGIELKTPFLSELTHLEGTVLASHERVKDIIYETRLEFLQLSPQAEFVLNKIIQYFEKEASH